MDMSGKTVLVTGAASGIGRATALEFAVRDASRIACIDVHKDGNAETAELVRKAGAVALPVEADLGSVNEIRSAYATVLDAFGNLDACAHIGGYSWRAETLDITEAQWDHFIDVNLRGTFFCCQEALKAMYARGSGAIVNMSADAAFYPMSGLAAQAACKGGIALMSRTLALEAARRGVRVNTVSPGIVLVEPTGAPKPPAPPLRDRPPPSIAELPGKTVPGRWIEAREIARSVVYLCSDAASGISGTVQFVNGGGYYAFEY